MTSDSLTNKPKSKATFCLTYTPKGGIMVLTTGAKGTRKPKRRGRNV